LSDLSIDLNADLGEGAGHDEELLGLVSSANIATGFHAGDAESMRVAIAEAHERGVAVGAHPSLFDRENFGRREMTVTAGEVYDGVVYQLGVFAAIAEAAGVRPAHVKPHGALYNMAARDAVLADAVARAVASVDTNLVLFALAGSQLEKAGQARGLRVAREFFADRNYMENGSLVPRSRPDAVLDDPEAAAQRVVRLLRHGSVPTITGTDLEIKAETICVHGDTPGAVTFVRTLRAHLEQEHVHIQVPLKS
jgi:UPF0271 protein